jgi:hypothetical protein
LLGVNAGLVGNTVVHDPKVPLPPKLTSLPPALMGVLPLPFQVASALVTNPCIKKKPVALGTLARKEAVDEGLRVTELFATLTQMALLSEALEAEIMKMP